MRYHEVNALITRLAKPYGAVTGSILIPHGVTRRMIEGRLGTGFLTELENDTYGVAGFPLTWERQYKAAELSVPGAGLAGLAAALVQRFDGFRTVRAELVAPYTRSVRNKIATVHRSKTALMELRHGFRVTTVAQTLFDILNRVSLDRLEHTMDAAILTKRCTVEDLEERRQAYAHAHKPGIELWRALVDERLEDGWAPPESDLEATLWDIFREIPDHPSAARQAPAFWQTVPGRVDIYVPVWNHIIEADGRRWHARVNDFDADRWRDAQAVANGFSVQRFTHLHLTQRRAEVRDLIAAVGAHRHAA